ncbi:hypothetical protein RHECNPAF_137007 [Rhizobium etli CNPAF512]|nr:hypothetical protein RHECNPAF_137007 [Rhizobium etli CNPAF512]
MRSGVTLEDVSYIISFNTSDQTGSKLAAALVTPVFGPSDVRANLLQKEPWIT